MDFRREFRNPFGGPDNPTQQSLPVSCFLYGAALSMGLLIKSQIRHLVEER